MTSKVDAVCEAILGYGPLVEGREVSTKALLAHARTNRSVLYWAVLRLMKQNYLVRSMRGHYRLAMTPPPLPTDSRHNRQITVLINGLSVSGAVQDIRDLLGRLDVKEMAREE